MTEQTTTRFSRRQRLLLSILGCLPLPLTVAVLGPLDVYSSNREMLGEFFSAGDFLPISALIGLAAAAALFLLLYFLPDRGFRIALPIVLALSLSATILTFVNRSSDLPGDAQSVATTLQNVLGILIPCLLLAGGIVGFLLVKQADHLTLASCLVLIPLLFAFVVSFISIPLSTPDIFAPMSDEKKNGKILTSDGISDLGEDANVIYICIDRFDEGFFDVANEIDPTIFANLDGFTHYTDHITLYSNTYPAVCYMLTGYEPDFTLSRSEILKTGFSNPRLLGALRDAGYSIGVYANEYYSYDNVENIVDYVDNVPPNGHFEGVNMSKLPGEMLALSLFRSSPSVTAPLFDWLSTKTLTDQHRIYVDDSDTNKENAFKDDKSMFNDVGNNEAKAELDRRGFTVVRNGKRFTYLHIAGMHDVYNPKTSSRDAIVRNLRESFAVVNAYLDALRANGLYKNATIIVTGDHPCALSDSESVAERGEPRITALFVKRRGDEGTPCRVSTAQVYQAQIVSEIFDAEGIPLTDDDPLPLSKTPEGIDVERFHMFMVQKNGEFDCETWRIYGPAADFSNWEKASSVHYKHSLYN